jgi:hypothetical protein
MKDALQENERITAELERTRSVPYYHCYVVGGGWCYKDIGYDN